MGVKGINEGMGVRREFFIVFLLNLDGIKHEACMQHGGKGKHRNVIGTGKNRYGGNGIFKGAGAGKPVVLLCFGAVYC